MHASPTQKKMTFRLQKQIRAICGVPGMQSSQISDEKPEPKKSGEKISPERECECCLNVWRCRRQWVYAVHVNMAKRRKKETMWHTKNREKKKDPVGHRTIVGSQENDKIRR